MQLIIAELRQLRLLFCQSSQITNETEHIIYCNATSWLYSLENAKEMQQMALFDILKSPHLQMENAPFGAPFAQWELQRMRGSEIKDLEFHSRSKNYKCHYKNLHHISKIWEVVLQFCFIWIFSQCAQIELSDSCFSSY